MLVAVYGTLRRGEGNHRLLNDSTYKGHARINGYAMVNLGFFPAAGRAHGTIQTEVYDVDTKTMQRLDDLEGYPRHYNREQVDTQFGPAWLYIYEDFPPNRGSPVPSGDWKDAERLSLAMLTK